MKHYGFHVSQHLNGQHDGQDTTQTIRKTPSYLIGFDRLALEYFKGTRSLWHDSLLWKKTSKYSPPGSDCWRRGKETSFSIYTTLVAMCCTIVYEWTGGRYLVVIHHCVEWFNPHRINVSIQHNPLRSYVGDVCLLSHQWWKQTLNRGWRTQTTTEITMYKYLVWASTGSCVLNFVILIQNQLCLPSFHSRVAGWIKPNNSSLSTAFGLRSFQTGFLFKFT